MIKRNSKGELIFKELEKMTRVIKKNSGGILLIDYGYDRDFDTFST